jgi:tricorn protease
MRFAIAIRPVSGSSLANAALALLSALVIMLAPVSAWQESRPWIRYPAISPDGKQIAFSYQGDIWVVPAKGGAARMITSHEGYERSPVWSPDGKGIAFMADWNDSGDVYLASADSGVPLRLTWHSSADEPVSFTPDGKHVLVTSRIQDAPGSFIGTTGMGELYRIPVGGGRPVQVMTTTAEWASFDRAGKRLVFHDYKGFEDEFRKHHTSSVTRDIWMYEPESKKYTQLSGFQGEDLTPVWSPDGQSVYFLSEQVEATGPGEKGKNAIPAAPEGSRVIPQLTSSFNVWMLDVANPAKQTQVTSHSIHPVRYLTIAGDGTLCYIHNSEIWIKRPDADPSPVAVRLRTGMRANPESLKVLRDGATEFAVSPNEEEIAFVARGEVFVANVEFGTTRRITGTATQERSVTWGDDGRTLYYAGERNDSWNLYKATLGREDEEGFANATVIDESPVLVTTDETFQPVCSPDGKKLAYLRNRREIMVLDLASGESKSLVPADKNFSYTDGDIEYRWSPDSRWLAVTWHGHESWIPEIGAVNIETGQIVNMTDSGYSESGPAFAAGGKALIYASDRYGERSHGSWGGELDVIAVYLTQAAFDEATLDKEQLALKKKREEADKKKKEKEEKGQAKETGKDEPADKQESDVSGEEKQEPAEGAGEESSTGNNDDEKKDEEEKKAEPIEFETENLDLRRRRLTLHSSQIGSFDLSPDGEHLIYTAQVDDKWGLWLTKVRDRSTSNILPLGGDRQGRGGDGGGNGGGGIVRFSKDGKSAFLMQGGKLSKVGLAGALGDEGGKAKSEPVNFAAEMVVDENGERQYIFDHAWRQVKDKFYDEKLHGVDWESLRKNYAAFLPTINNNHDFAELLSELLGELNASHTGCRYRPSRQDTDNTASLGLLFDLSSEDAGLKVAEVIERGPCDRAECKIVAGTVVTHINGVELAADVNPWKLLNRQAGKPVRLSLSKDGTIREETIRPISNGEESNLLYERWIAECRKRCEELSGGRIGYVHVRGMNDGSFRRVYDEVLGKNNEKEALIVDTRFNGGGWLHEDLATFLGGERYIQFAPRGFEKGGLGGEPVNKWTRPVAVLQSESNYSDAHFFPWAFRVKGIGKLIGAPVPGTATAVWWEGQINPDLVFGIPQVGMLTEKGTFLENEQLEPDVLVLNDPPAVAAGRDPQLETAVQTLIAELNQKPSGN